MSWGRRSRLLAARERRRLLVTLKSGAVFEGVLFDSDGHALCLRDAQSLATPGSAPLPVDGELLVLFADIDFLQRP